MVNALTIATVSAPVLKSPKVDAIVKFRVDYKRYLSQIQQINSGIADDAQRVRTFGYESCTAGELLLSIVELNTYKDITKVEEVSDNQVRSWLEARGRCTTADTPKRVKDALR